MKRRLSIFIRFIIWAKKTCTQQIIFISSDRYLRKVAQDMQAGRTNILTKMERKILADIRDIRRHSDHEINFNAIDMKLLNRTMDFTKFGKVVQWYVQLVIEILATYSECVCYITMIASMMINAGFISLVYPLIVFGYALMEEVNPRKGLWYAIMIYTEILILAKFLF